MTGVVLLMHQTIEKIRDIYVYFILQIFSKLHIKAVYVIAVENDTSFQLINFLCIYVKQHWIDLRYSFLYD